MGIVVDFASFSPSERLFHEFIPSLIRAGLSSNSIIRAARANGLGIRRTVGLSLIRYARQQVDVSTYVSGLGAFNRPNTQRLGWSAAPMERHYRYTTIFSGLDTQTGKPTFKYVIFQSDDLLTRQGAQERAIVLLSVRGVTRYFDVATVNLAQVEKNVAMYGVL